MTSHSTIDHGWLVHTLSACARTLRHKGMDVKDNVVLPPATEAEILAVEESLGLTLPPSMRSTFAQVTAGIEWSWWLPEGEELPGEFRDIFSGSTFFSLERLRQERVLGPEWETDDVYCIAHEAPQRPGTLLPFCHVGNGDVLAVDLAPGRAGQVVYVECHGDLEEGHLHRMASGLPDLLERWSPLGQPGPEFWQWRTFVSGDGPIDPHAAPSRKWRQAMGLP